MPSTYTIADQIHESGKAGKNCKISVDNGRENQKQIIEELMWLVKNMEINQTNYANDMRTLCTCLEKRDKEMEIMKIKHFDHVTDMQSQHAKEIETMKANHDREINFMQSKLSGLEENMTIMELNHSNQVIAMEASFQEEISAIQNQLSIMDDEMTIMTFDYNNQLATM